VSFAINLVGNYTKLQCGQWIFTSNFILNDLGEKPVFDSGSFAAKVGPLHRAVPIQLARQNRQALRGANPPRRILRK
jgi:hypothetical protein